MDCIPWWLFWPYSRPQGRFDHRRAKWTFTSAGICVSITPNSLSDPTQPEVKICQPINYVVDS